jgi:hypothetical protein
MRTKYRLTLRGQLLPKFIRRNRRLIAALFAGLSVLTFTSTLNPVDVDSSQNAIEIPPGKSAIAIQISSELMREAISVGKEIDLLSVENGYSSKIANAARVLRIGNSNSRLSGSTTEVLIAISMTEATKVAAANQAGSIQVLISETN